ncbi:hypothetical protein CAUPRSCDRAFT_12216 [Caulochytrium protostelioides]|uniref:Uncharacterized protein n=1 Tax=Caulochytrium protostelioides TaxID=1555241 RepID=A0A4P9WSF9_9FUNG|nr:hypothetical protein CAUPRSCDRAFT_12216 [Caulochytrium protostelioides]
MQAIIRGRDGLLPILLLAFFMCLTATAVPTGQGNEQQIQEARKQEAADALAMLSSPGDGKYRDVREHDAADALAMLSSPGDGKYRDVREHDAADALAMLLMNEPIVQPGKTSTGPSRDAFDYFGHGSPYAETGVPEVTSDENLVYTWDEYFQQLVESQRSSLHKKPTAELAKTLLSPFQTYEDQLEYRLPPLDPQTKHTFE